MLRWEVIPPKESEHMPRPKMTKFKSRKAVVRRVKVTGTGKILRGRSFGRHLKANKTKKQNRIYKRPIEVNKTLEKKLQKALGLR